MRTEAREGNGGFEAGGSGPGHRHTCLDESDSRLRRRALILSVIVLVLFVLGIRIFYYIPDDTYITLRYARNVIDGKGFVFNEGERLEGYTNYLWLIILILIGKLGGSLPTAARTLSLIASCATLILAGYIAWVHRPPRASGWSAALAVITAPLLLAASPPFLTWSLSGTEIPLFTFLLLLGVAFITTGRNTASVLVVFGLLGLVRPEGILFYILAGAILLDTKHRKGDVIVQGAWIFALMYAPYLIWKWRYFGGLLPNTFYAKTGPIRIMTRNGMSYLLGFLARYGYFLVIGILMLHKHLRDQRRVTVPVFFILIHWAEVLILGGDWMPHYRLLLPTLPLIALVVSYGLMKVGARSGDIGDGTKWRNPVPVVVTILVVLAMIPGGIGYDEFIYERIVVGAYVRLGQVLGEILPPTTSIALGSTGAIGFYSGLEIIDILGLTERHIAHEGRIVATQPGHMKADGRYVLKQKPDLLLLGNVQIHLGRRSEDEMPIKIQEREITKQPEFAKRYEFINIPIGRNFYLSCYKHRDLILSPE
ncbi:MAG: hypothetical protein JSV33_16115 [bacterium]|nr:MAG: hypothetical protein JSV33_16115 [bacterium]